METIKKNDFIELKFTGYSNGVAFDSNIEEDLKKINPEAKPAETIVIVGQGMVVPGLDNAFEGKEIGKDYEIDVPAKGGFGLRDRNLVKIIPLKVFTEKNISPRPGMVFALDNTIAKVIVVSGARVTTDFNNPLAGKDLKYRFRIVRKITDEKEKCKFLFENTLKSIPEFEVGEKVIIRGSKDLEIFVREFSDKFKELIGKEMSFELKEEAVKEEKVEEKENQDNGKEEGR
jgi:FKBP-type peptidyl-prolyl cis-trans isomerase 2